MVDQQGQFTLGSPNRDHRCGVLPVYRQQYSGLGCPLAGTNCIWHLVPGPIPTTHRPKSFQPKSGECEGCSHVRQHVSGCLPEKSGGTKSLTMNDLATDICLWSEKRGMTLVPRYLPGHLNVLADHLSRRGQILKTEWSLNQTVADRIFRAWGRPFVDLFGLGKNTKLAIYVSPIREETSWKVDSLVQNCDLNMLVRNFAVERPVQHREAPRWDLMVVLRLLMKPPFAPMNMASLADMTRKIAFLLTLASAKRNSEVWAFSADVRFGQDYNAATLSFLPSFLANTMDPSRPETDYAPVTIPALGPSMGEDLPSGQVVVPSQGTEILFQTQA